MNAVIGQSYTTAKSGVTGVVQEIVANKNGTFRVLLDVNGNPRWTTIKQFSLGEGSVSYPFSALPTKMSDPLCIM